MTCDYVFDLGLKFVLEISINHISEGKKKRINPFLFGENTLGGG